MKRLVPFLVLFLLVACNKEDKLTYTEKRLIGAWFYSNVDYRPNWGIKKDITKEYFGQILTFDTDFTLSLENSQTNEIFGGVWQVNQQIVNNNNNNSAFNEQVIASYTNSLTGEINQLVWDNFTIYRNRIVANYSAKEGTYYLELKKF